MKRFFLLIGLIISLATFTPLNVHAQQSDASLQLRPSVSQVQKGQSFYVDVYVKNPSGQSIVSVRNWLKYNPEDLEVKSIERAESPFTLAAPGEDMAAPKEKLIKMGYSNVNGGSNSPEALVARVNFNVLTGNAKETLLEFYDYQVSELGHTSVNVVAEGLPLNILGQKPGSVTLNLNGGAPAEIGGETENPILTASEGVNRPLNLKANTGNGYVHLKWDKIEEASISGYYLYYGKTPGLYTRRKDVANVDSFILEGLKNGETYYFAVTAHRGTGDESDYSNEVGVIVGEPLSSTHPFEDLVNNLLAQVPVQPQNGPLMNWFLIISIGLGIVIGLGRKTQKAI